MQYKFRMMFTLLFWRFLFIFSSFFTVVICIESENVVKTSDCVHLLVPNSTIHINPYANDCKVYIIKADKTSSIISISTISNGTNTVRALKEYSEDSSDGSIDVFFNEFTILKDKTKSSILTKQWELTPKEFTRENIYFSRTSELNITVTVNGKWSDNGLRLLCEEVTHKDFTFSVGGSSSSGGVITPYMRGSRYRPNCVTLFQIIKPPKRKINSIDIVLDNLDIDEGIDEYLLIGAGNAPSKGSPPLFISSDQRKRYKINDENAYIVFVASSTRTRRDGFKITWQYNETKISGEKDEIDHMRRDDVLQSVQACIYNISAAQMEFNKSEERFQKFRESFAEIGMEYAANYSLRINTITSSHVDIFRVSDVIPDEALVVMIKIQGSKEGKAAFTWKQLQDIMGYYSSYCSEDIDGYKIGRCPAQSSRNPWINVAFYGIIPGLCLFFLFIWTWKNTLSEYFKKRIKRAAQQIKESQELSAVPMEDNIYSNEPLSSTVPKVCNTSDQGRRYTLNFEQIVSSCAEDDSDIEIFNKMNFKSSFKRQGNYQDSPSIRSSVRSSKKPEINLAFEEDDECILTNHQPQQNPQTQSETVEHFYDTVKSMKNYKKEITVATKL